MGQLSKSKWLQHFQISPNQLEYLQILETDPNDHTIKDNYFSIQ